MTATAMLQLATAYWPLLALVSAMLITRIASVVYERQRLAQSGIDEIDHMTGEAFERRLEILFCRRGYHVQLTPTTGDFGADLILAKDGVKTAVQAKRHADTVGVAAVQQIMAAKAHYQCSQAMVVTNNHYSPQARTLARENGVELWDRHHLTTALLQQQPSASGNMAVTKWAVRAGVAIGLVLCGVAIWLGGRALFTELPSAIVQGRPAADVGAPPSLTTAVPIPRPGGAPPITLVEAAPVGPATCGTATVGGVKALNIRAAPDTSSQVIGARPAGTVVELLCAAPVDAEGRTWRHVRSDDAEGWMSERYLAVTPTQGE